MTFAVISGDDGLRIHDECWLRRERKHVERTTKTE